MRALCMLLVAAGLLTLVPVEQTAQAKSDPKKLIDEYLAEQTSDARRGEITAELELQPAQPCAALEEITGG